MIFRLTSMLLFYSISLFSTEIGVIHNQLKSCQNYNKNNDMQQGVFNWIASVDNIKGCDIKQINFILLNKNRLTVKSNLSLLKSNYEFCDGIENLGKAFNAREFRLKNMKKTCDNSNIKKIDYAKKIKEMNRNYQEAKENLIFLKRKKEKIDSVLEVKNKEAIELKNNIEKIKNRIKKIEGTLRELEQ